MHHGMNVYGTATVGSKGQIVIPSEARGDLNINEGDKVFVVGIKDKCMLGIVPVENMDAWMNSLRKNLEAIEKASRASQQTEQFED